MPLSSMDMPMGPSDKARNEWYVSNWKTFYLVLKPGLLRRQFVVVQRGLEITLARQESSVTKSYATLPGDGNR